jgi:hypothetical protein
MIKSVTTLSLVALLLAAAFATPASAAGNRGPRTDLGLPGSETRPVTSPGDPFVPPSSNAPKGNPDKAVYPDLICWFEIVDGKVIIHWVNIGTAPVPVGAIIKGTTSGGIGLSWHMTQEVPPGGKLTSIPLDMDPAWFNEPCNASIKA